MALVEPEETIGNSMKNINTSNMASGADDRMPADSALGIFKCDRCQVLLVCADTLQNSEVVSARFTSVTHRRGSCVLVLFPLLLILYIWVVLF